MFDFYVDGIYQDKLKQEIGELEQRTSENVITKEDTINQALNKFDGEMGENLICTAWQDFAPSGVNYTLTQDENATTPYDITEDISKVDNNLNRFIVVKDDDSKAPVRASGILNAFTYVKVTGYEAITGELTLNYEPKSNFRILYKYTFPKHKVPNGKLFGDSISQNVADGDASDEAIEIKYDNTDSGMLQDNVKTAIDNTYNQSLYSNGGMINQPTFLDNGDGSVSIGSGQARFYDNTEWNGEIYQEDINSEIFTLVDSLTQLNYIVADYNSGSPIYRLTTNLSEINGSTIIPVFTALRDGVEITKLSWNSYGMGYPEKSFKKDIEINRFDIKEGLALGETGIRNITITSGGVYYGTKLEQLSSVDTSIDDLYFFYHSSGSWVKSTVNQYNNLNYDDGTDLQELTNNKYAVNWVWRNIDEDKPSACVVLGQGNYSLAEAENSIVPSPPPAINGLCVLIGRIIVEKGENIAERIQRVLEVNLATAGINNHNNLDGLSLAGAGVTYGHIDEAAKEQIDTALTRLANTSGTNTGDQTSIVGIAGTKAQFNTAVTDGDIAYLNESNTFTEELTASSTLTLGNFSTAERDALNLGVSNEGAIIFNTTTKKFQGWDGTQWVDFHGYGS